MRILVAEDDKALGLFLPREPAAMM